MSDLSVYELGPFILAGVCQHDGQGQINVHLFVQHVNYPGGIRHGL